MINSQEQLLKEWQEIQLAQAKPALFRPLYERYYNNIFKYIHRRTTDEHLAAELCAQTFLKALQKLSTYEYKGVPFSAWLYRIASNEVAMHYRHVQKNRVVAIQDSNIHDLITEVENENNALKEEMLLACLDDLSDDQLSLVEMRFFEQRPFKEIADILSITEANAKMRTYRILEKLKKNIMQKMKHKE